MSDLEGLNEVLRGEAPVLHACLSDLGKRVVFPPGIPFQAAEAAGAAINATIGQITDGDGNGLALPALNSQLAALEAEDRNRAFLYSPIQGIEELRDRWRQRQRRQTVDSVPSTRPLVTVGLTHGLSLVADLFGGLRRAVAIPSPFWGNYRETFGTRTGARLLSAPTYRDGHYNCEAVAEALSELPVGEPALAILNLPSNPGGYSLTAAERERVKQSLVSVADQRPLLVICDDAYAGLVYEEGVPERSMFWDLLSVHPNLAPVKIDGGTKEFNLFGGRVGFLTFGLEPESAAARALESKVKCLTRATVGSPVATSQILLLQALRRGDIENEVTEVRRILAGRYRALKSALSNLDPALLRPLPFNSGCFCLLQLPERLHGQVDSVRRRLLEDQRVGVISIQPEFLRVAFCSVAESDLEPLVERLAAGVDAPHRRRSGR